MSNQIGTSDLIVKATGYGYINNLGFVKHINREYSDEFKNKEFTPGDTVRGRLPVLFTASEGQAFQEQAIYEAFVPITVEKQFHVDMGFSTWSETFDIREIRDRYIDPQMQILANKVDVYAIAKCTLDVYNIVGTPGTTPTSPLTFLQAGVKLTNQGVGKGGRNAVLHPLSNATLSVAGATYLNPVGKISEAYRTGEQPDNSFAVNTWSEDPNILSYTTGTFTASTPLVNGANQTGSSIITNGWASGASSLTAGDTFTMGGVYTVNPVSKNNTAALQDFVVTAPINDTTGAMTISISPSIITSGSLQTVTASPASGAVITVRGATSAAGGTLAATVTPQNLIFNKDFATLVTVDLAKPNGGAEVGRISSKEMALAMRIAKQWDIRTDKNLTRCDVAVGAKTLQARLAARIAA